jgi:DnaJ-class molecular chaperone
MSADDFQPPDPPETEIDVCDACGGSGLTEVGYPPCSHCSGRGKILRYLDADRELPDGFLADFGTEEGFL